jgi:hypothetical protein
MFPAAPVPWRSGEGVERMGGSQVNSRSKSYSGRSPRDLGSRGHEFVA